MAVKEKWTVQPIDVVAGIPNTYPLCKEVAQILNHPINKNRKPQTADFLIPPFLKNFHLPKWEEVPKEQWKEYVIVESFPAIEGTMQLVYKTSVDIDHDGNREEMMRIVMTPMMNNETKKINPSTIFLRISKKDTSYLNHPVNEYGQSGDEQGNNGFLSFGTDWHNFLFSYKRSYYMGGYNSIVEGKKYKRIIILLFLKLTYALSLHLKQTSNHFVLPIIIFF